MWTYEKARKYLIESLLHDAKAQERGTLEKIGTGYEQFDINLQSNNEPRFNKLYIALNFWDGWIDSQNHSWKYYEPILEKDWPRLARSIVSNLEADGDVKDPLVLEKFDLKSNK